MRPRPALLVLAFLVGCGAAPAPAPTPIADDRPSDQGALARLASTWPDGTSRTCAITWTSPGTAWLYDGSMTLARTGARVAGSIHWRLLSADAGMPELAARVGSMADEQIAGAFDPTIRGFLLRTTSVSDETLIGSALYRIELVDGGFRGQTAGVEDGIWDGVLQCSAEP